MGNFRPNNLPVAQTNSVALTDFNNAMTELKNMLFSGIKKNLAVIVNAANHTSQIDIDADTLGVEDYILKSINLTLDITASGANGLDTGSEATNTWYSIWVIFNPTTNTTAGLLSISTDSPTMPAGYTKKRRVGWVRNDPNNNFLTFWRKGDICFLDSDILSDNDQQPSNIWTNAGTTRAMTVIVPPGTSSVFVSCLANYVDSNENILVRPKGSTGIGRIVAKTTSDSVSLITTFQTAINIDRQFQYRFSAPTADRISFWIGGYVEGI